MTKISTEWPNPPDKLFNEAARCFETISKSTTKMYTQHLISLFEENPETFTHLTSRPTEFQHFFTALCRLCIQSDGRKWLSTQNFIETVIRINFQLLTSMNHELKRSAIFALCHLTRESVHRSKFKPENFPKNNLLQLQPDAPKCTHLLCPSHTCLLVQTSTKYHTVQASCTAKQVNISLTNQSGLLVIVQLIKHECLRVEPTQYEEGLLSVLYEFYNDNSALEIFKSYELVKILVEALSINRKIFEEAPEDFKTSEWIDTDLIDHRDTLSLDVNFTTQPGSGSIQKQTSTPSTLTHIDFFTNWVENSSEHSTKSNQDSHSDTDSNSETSSNLSSSSNITPPPHKKFKRRSRVRNRTNR